MTADTVTATTESRADKVQAFSFGDPEPVLDRRQIYEAFETPFNGRWYEPPVSRDGLSSAYRSSPHHTSALIVKRNLLASTFKPSSFMSRDVFSALALDYLVFGDCFVRKVRNVLGGPLRCERLPAKYSRVGREGAMWFVPGWGLEVEYAAGDVVQLLEHDLDQEFYGVPDYMAAIQAALLNENATLFRRRYYLNGSHAGFIFYMTDAAADEKDIDELKEKFKASKGPGNFRNLFLYAPNGKKDGVQIIPISEVAAKDEFLNIKNVTRDDILAAHRVPPQLIGLVPANAGGFGDVAKARDVFFESEIIPLQRRFEALNEALGFAAIAFEPYVKASSAA